jgi:hypothetical protein
MQFISLRDIRSFFGGAKNYDKTPLFYGVNILLNGGKGEILNPESIDAYDVYSTTPHLKAVISRKGDLLASGQWKHYKIIRGEKIEVVNSEIVGILENPNALFKGNDYLRLINENMCVYGNVYKYVLRPFKKSIPASINILPSNDIEIKSLGKWYKQSKLKDIVKEYRMISTNDTLQVDEVDHTWIVNSKNPLQGETPLKAIYLPLSNLRIGMKTRNVLMAKRGAIGILSNDTKDAVGNKGLPNGEREKIEKEYQKSYGLGDDQSQIIISNNNLKWQAMGFPTKDLMLFEEDENDFCQLCDCYGIARDLFASTKGATFENQKQALKQTYQGTIIPEAEEIAMNHTSIFNLDGVNEWLELDYSHIPVLQENELEKSQTLQNKSNAIKTLKDAGYSDQQITSITGVTL